MKNWKLVLATIAIIATVISTSVVITASNINELRQTDKEHLQLIYEIETQTKVIINELGHIKRELKEHGRELREIRAILEEMNGE